MMRRSGLALSRWCIEMSKTVLVILLLFTVTVSAAFTRDTAKFQGHRYKTYRAALSWSEARDACEKMGGHLVTINSEEEQDFVTHLILRGNANCYWIGGIKVPGRWQWITGEAVTYRNWAKDEPNNADGNEVVIMMYGKTSSNIGQWNDESPFGNPYDDFYNLENFGFVCEWE